MRQAIVNLGQYENRILTIVKRQYGLKDKSEAINFIINRFGKEFIEPSLKPEYVRKIKDIENKGKFIDYKKLSTLKTDLDLGELL